MSFVATPLTARPLTARSLTAVAVGEAVGEAVAGFNPADLFGPSDVGALFDIQQLSTLFQNAAGTTSAGVGDPVGRVEDISGDGNHATQTTDTSRPTLAREPEGGRRNLIVKTEDFSAPSVWLEGGLSVTSSSGVGSITGISNQFFTLTRREYDTTDLSSRQFTFSIKIKAIGADVGKNIRIVIANISGTSSNTFSTNIALTDAYVRHSITHTFAAGAIGLQVQIRGATADLASAVQVTEPQIEESSTATSYQKVVSEFDITEEGVESVYYLADDGDDALTVGMPDLGTDATRVIFNRDGTVTYLENQTIGAGDIDIPLGNKGVMYIDRDLTAGEKSDLDAWNA